jgi:hypothetical protein
VSPSLYQPALSLNLRLILKIGMKYLQPELLNLAL